MKNQPENPVARAIAIAGNQALLAKAANVSQQAASKWLAAGRVPPKAAVKIEKKYGINRADLCPDVFGPAPEQQAAP